MSLNWYDENEGRSYPLAEFSTQEDQEGRELPTDLVVDLTMSLPEEYLDSVRVAAVGVRGGVPSITVAAKVGGEDVTLLSATQRVSPYEPLALNPLVNDVAGLVVFGNGILHVGDLYLFDEVGQSGVALRAVRGTRSPAVTSIAVEGHEKIVDVLTLLAGDNLEIAADPDNDNRILLSLLPRARANFVGPCDRTAESVSGCGLPPLRTINGVGPDGDGIITVEFV